jgi:tetratricopeptide (TPR) repeat protein
MNRRTIAFGGALAIVAGIGAYKYYEHIEEKRAAQARMDAAIAVQLALAARKKAETVSAQDQETLVTMAREWLDGGQIAGQASRARGNLETVLKSNRHHVGARIEMARYHMVSGYINYRNYQPGTLDAAIGELQFALAADPKSADAYVMLGHVQQQRGYPWQALGDLQKAERLGGETNPWLYLNWADALQDLNQLQAAEAKLRQAEARFGIKAPPIRARLALHDKFAGLYTMLHRLDEADTHYKVHIALDPRAPWPRGN